MQICEMNFRDYVYFFFVKEENTILLRERIDDLQQSKDILYSNIYDTTIQKIFFQTSVNVYKDKNTLIPTIYCLMDGL